MPPVCTTLNGGRGTILKGVKCPKNYCPRLEVASKAYKCLEKLHGDKGTELEMEVRSRLSDKSTSSQEHSADKSDSSLTDEDETITKTQYARQTEIGARRKNVMFTPDEDKYLQAGLKRYGFGQWKATLRDPDFHFHEGRTPNSLLSRAARKFGSYSKRQSIIPS